jgi:hypothetical protein
MLLHNIGAHAGASALVLGLWTLHLDFVANLAAEPGAADLAVRGKCRYYRCYFRGR